MIAYLIMCHKNVDQVIRLAKKIKTENSHVYIHADKHMENVEFDKLLTLKNNHGIFILEDRLHGKLFDRTLVDIEVKLLLFAKSSFGDYKYYVLLSGQDYPIKNINEIENQLEKSYPAPFIDCTPYDKQNWVGSSFRTCSFIKKYIQWITSTLKKGIIRYFHRIIQITLSKIIEVLKLTTYDVLKRKGVKLYGGSQWWILPDKIVTYICDEYLKMDSYIKILLNGSGSPDETFFQTVAMRSAYRDIIELNPIDRVSQNCKTWSYFSDNGKPFVGHPYVFTINDFEKLKKSDFWFARKFDITEDTEILNKLDEV